MKKTLVTSKRLYMLVVLLLVLCISPAVSLAKVTFDAEKITANYKEISLSQLFWKFRKHGFCICVQYRRPEFRS